MSSRVNKIASKEKNREKRSAALSLIQVDIPEQRYQLAYEILQQELMQVIQKVKLFICGNDGLFTRPSVLF